jgi:hypothetical protein
MPRGTRVAIGESVSTMNTDRPLVATPPEPPRFPTGLDPIFQHDQFLIGLKLAVADKRTISDAQGRPLLIVTSPSRLGRLVLGLLTAVVVFPLAHLVFRWLLPNCVYFKPDRQTIVGVLRRDHQAPEGRHLLDLAQDRECDLDPRIALAFAVVLFEQ